MLTKKDIIKVTKTNIFNRKKIHLRRASDCLSAKVVKKGIDSKIFMSAFSFN